MTINGQLNDRVDRTSNNSFLGNFKRDIIEEVEAKEIPEDTPVTLSKREAMMETISQHKVPLTCLSVVLFSVACVCSVMYIRKLKTKKTIDESIDQNEVQMSTLLTL